MEEQVERQLLLEEGVSLRGPEDEDGDQGENHVGLALYSLLLSLGDGGQESEECPAPFHDVGLQNLNFRRDGPVQNRLRYFANLSANGLAHQREVLSKHLSFL